MFCMWKININYLFIELKQGFGVLKGNGFCGVIRYNIDFVQFFINKKIIILCMNFN